MARGRGGHQLWNRRHRFVSAHCGKESGRYGKECVVMKGGILGIKCLCDLWNLGFSTPASVVTDSGLGGHVNPCVIRCRQNRTFKKGRLEEPLFGAPPPPPRPRAAPHHHHSWTSRGHCTKGRGLKLLDKAYGTACDIARRLGLQQSPRLPTHRVDIASLPDPNGSD